MTSITGSLLASGEAAVDRLSWENDDARAARSSWPYDRFHRLSTAGVQTPCPACGFDDNYLWPKFIGHSSSYEASCDSCSAADDSGLCPYAHGKVVRHLLRLYTRFQRGDPPADLDAVMAFTARRHDRHLARRDCDCLRGLPAINPVD